MVEFLNPFVQNDNRNAFPEIAFNPADLPQMPAPPQQNAITAGIAAGYQGLKGAVVGGGAGLVGAAIGSQSLQDYGNEVHDAANAAVQSGRPDLEIAPWQKGGAGWLPYTGYQLAKMAAPMVAIGGAGAALAALPVTAPIAGALGLTGLGLRAGAALGLGEDAAAGLGAKFLGNAAAAYPMSAGQMFNEAQDREEQGGAPAGRGDALQAALFGVPHAATNGLLPMVAPGIFMHAAEQGASTGLAAGAKALAKGMGLGGVENAAAMGAQTALQQTMRPDLSMSEKIDNILDATTTGLFVGGAMGGVAHAGGRVFRAVSGRDPNSISNEDLKQLSAPEGAPGKTTVEPTGGTMYVDPAGNVAQDQASVGGKGFGQSEAEATGGLRQLDLNAQAREEAPPPPSRSEQFAHVEDDDLQRMLAHAESMGDNANPEVLRAVRSEMENRASNVPQNEPPRWTHGAVYAATSEHEASGRPGMDLGDAQFELETLLDHAQKGKLTPERFAGSDFGSRLDTGQIMAINDRLRADPAGTIQSLLDRVNAKKPNEPTTLINENDLRTAQDAPPPAPTAEEIASQSNAESEARRQQIDRAETQKKAEELAGGSNQFTKKLTAENDVELAHQVLDYLDTKKGKKDGRAQKIARGLGLIDEDGKPVDHAAEIDAAKDDLAAARVARLSEDPAGDMRNQSPTEHTYMDGVGSIEGAETMGGVHAAQTRIAKLSEQQKLAQEVQRRRAGGDAADPQARSEAPPASTGPAPDFQMPLAPGAPRGFYETRKYLSGVVGGADSVVRGMEAKNLPEAIQATHDNLSARDPKKWSKTFRALGDHFGLLDEQGKLMPLPEAVQNMSDKFEAAKRAGDAEAAGQFSQKLDALNGALHGKIEEKPITGPSAVKAPEAPTGKLDDESKFRQGKLRDAMHTIERSGEGIPRDLRTRAREARQALNQRAASAEEKAHAVMAEYKAHTGDDLPSFSKSGVDQHADDYNAGEKIWDDGKLGLIRSVNRHGYDTYLPSKRLEDGSLWRSDKSVTGEVFDKATDHPFTKDELAHLRDLAAAHRAEDLARNDENTDGPFARMEPGTNAVGSKSIDPKMTGLLSDWMQMLGLDHMRVFLADPADLKDATGARTEYGLHAGFGKIFQTLTSSHYGSTSDFGARPGDRYITLKEGMSPQHAVETMGHELGHIVEKEVLDRLPTADKQAIVGEFHKWLAEKKGLRTAREYIQALRSAEAGREYAKSFSETTPTGSIMDGYHDAFKEWWADQVAKYMTTQAKPVGVVERFFHDLGQKLRTLMAVLTGKMGNKDHLPVAAVKDFLDKMVETRNADDLIKSLGGKGVRTSNTETIRGPAMADASRNVSPERQVEGLKSLTEKAADFGNDMWARIQDAKPTTYKNILGWRSVYDIAKEGLRTGFTGPQKYYDALKHREVVRSRYNGIFKETMDRLSVAEQKTRDLFNDIQRATEFGIDPRKPWAQQSERVHNAPNAVELKAEVERQNRNWNDLGRINQGEYQQHYNDLHSANNVVNYSMMAHTLHEMVSTNPKWQEALNFTSPSDEFLARSQVHESPAAADKFWHDKLNSMQSAVEEYVKTRESEKTGKSDKVKADIDREITPLIKAVVAHEQMVKTMKEAPNFHLGRSGEYFVAFNMREGAEGVVNKVAQENLTRELQKVAPGVQLSRASDKSNVFIRLESQAAAENLKNHLKDSRWIDPTSLQYNKRSAGEMFDAVAPEWLANYANAIDAHYDARIKLASDPAEVKRLEQMRDNSIAVARTQYLDTLPDTAIAKVLVHRDGVPGYAKDMVRNSAFRLQVAVNANANSAARPYIADAFKSMKEQIKEDNHNTDMSVQDKARRGFMNEELQRREQDRGMQDERGWSDILRAVNHNFYLAFNTAYAAINMTQLGTLTWPELAKNGGYIKAAKTLAQHTPTAIKIVKAAIQEGMEKSWKHMGDGAITQRVMDRAGLNATQKDFLTKLVNTGGIDIGAMSRVMGQIAEGKEGSHWSTASQMGSMFGLYSEMFSRLTAGFAAHDLAPPGVDPVLHAGKVIDESLYNYANWNLARQMGKNGIFKGATPVVMAFQSYNAFTIEKLTREFHDAFKGNEQQKAEARKFIGGHFAAMGMLTGALGLPIANVIAGATDKLHDLLSDDGKPYDSKAAFRNWIAGMTNKDVGEMVAHGPLSRAIGTEVTQRAGEQDMIPFTSLLTDRRKWEDAWKDYSSRGWGAPTSMMNSLITGARDLPVDPIHAMKEFLPVSLSNAVKAYDLAQHGYTDKNDQAIPQIKKPGPQDVLKQALGFTPAAKAEYNEGALVNSQRKTVLSRQAQVIRSQLAVAMERGDQADIQRWTAQAQEFDKHNQAFAVMPRMQGLLQARAMQRGVAVATHNQTGVNLKDIGARGLADFANY